MKFQDIVRCKRRELGLTQEQAARRLGVSPAAVQMGKWAKPAGHTPVRPAGKAFAHGPQHPAFL